MNNNLLKSIILLLRGIRAILGVVWGWQAIGVFIDITKLQEILNAQNTGNLFATLTMKVLVLIVCLFLFIQLRKLVNWISVEKLKNKIIINKPLSL